MAGIMAILLLLVYNEINSENEGGISLWLGLAGVRGDRNEVDGLSSKGDVLK